MTDDTLLVDDINDTWSDYPRDRCVDQIFSEHARSSPDRVAVVQGKQRLTYRQLDEASGRLASYLRSRGCAPGDVVGVCTDRSPEMIVTMLAILKAGGAYLPLDTDYPSDRLTFMATNANCRLIAGKARQLEAFADDDCVLLDLDAHADSIAKLPIEQFPEERASSDLAYVMYTSGTTGNPKGVLVQHYNISRLVLNTNYVTIDPDDVFLQLSSTAFDASTFEIWGALLNGATLVLYDQPHIDAGRISALLDEHRVTVLWLSSGLFNQMVEVAPTMFRSVRQLLAGGDVLSVEHLRKVMRVNPDCQLINGYGPTECTTFSVCCRIQQSHLAGSSVPIGRPIANCQVLILDQDRRPVHPGEAGELYIGGDGLSRGYLGAPALTAERFVNIPYNGRMRRWYKSGDLVRLGDDGNIYFLGRADRQLKVRGFRVEPAEIEAAILNCAGANISQAVVIGNTDKQGNKRLVAYVVGPSGKVPGAVELRDALRRTLPTYMIPATFVFLDQIPLTANGKIDRDRLPRPEWQPLSKSPALAARTPIEKSVAGLWAEIVRADRPIHLHDTVASIGGNDRHVAEIGQRLSSLYPIALGPGDIDDKTTTIASLVTRIRAELTVIQT